MHSLALRRSLLSVLCVAFIAPGCSGQASSAQSGTSPTATMNAYYDALKKKDVEAVKKTVSRGYLELLESAGVSAERAFQPMMDRLPAARPAIRNEKIDGDRATLEMRSEEGGRWDTIAFVKEDGAWKIALDQKKD